MIVVEKDVDLNIDTKDVYRCLGYGAEPTPPPRMLSLVDEYVEKAQNLMEPWYSYTIKDIERVEGTRVYCGNSIIFESEIVSKLLEKCDKVAVFLSTISNSLEETAGQLAENNHAVLATVLDAVGSVAADQVAEIAEDRVREIASSQGMAISRRFSPGYCGWDIGQQKVVFQVMNSDSVGIELTEGCLMIPQKSISGIIGMGMPREDYNPCITCEHRGTCSSRR